MNFQPVPSALCLAVLGCAALCSALLSSAQLALALARPLALCFVVYYPVTSSSPLPPFAQDDGVIFKRRQKVVLLFSILLVKGLVLCLKLM